MKKILITISLIILLGLGIFLLNKKEDLLQTNNILAIYIKQEDGRKVVANYGMDPKLGKYHRTYCEICQKNIEGKAPVKTCPDCDSKNITMGVFDRIEEIKDKKENKRYPIVIPIVIYTGRKTWKTKNSKLYGKVNYITYDNNKINFSYNMINIRDLKTEDLKEMESMVAKEILNKRITKNKYLQIN